MLTPPPSVTLPELREKLADAYGYDGPPPLFRPAGEDSWCYRAGDLWVSLRRDLLGHVPAAYRAAYDLHREGLDFLLAPIPNRDGGVVDTLGGLPLVVFPHVVGSDFRERAPSPAELDRAIGMLDRLHGAKPVADLPTGDFAMPYADALADMWRHLESGEPTLSRERARAALRRNRPALTELADERLWLAEQCRALDPPRVLTHGEPQDCNIMRAGDRTMLIDLGTLAWEPPERDWAHTRRTLGAGGACHPVLLRLYELDWLLSEVAEYGERLLTEAVEDDDTAAMEGRLLATLAVACAAE